MQAMHPGSPHMLPAQRQQHVPHNFGLSAQNHHAQVKSYLSGNPAISLALNDNLAIGRREGTHAADYGHGYGSDVVMLDDCNFHQAVSLGPLRH